MSTWTPASALKEGDTVIMDVPIYRRWWQVWKPRVRWEQRRYRATGKLIAALSISTPVTGVAPEQPPAPTGEER